MIELVFSFNTLFLIGLFAQSQTIPFPLLPFPTALLSLNSASNWTQGGSLLLSYLGHVYWRVCDSFSFSQVAYVMGSHKKGALPNAESKNAEARPPSASPTTPTNHAVMRSLAQERDLHRSQTAEMLADIKRRAEEIANVIARAERMADATMRPLRVWDEAAAVLEEREKANVKQEDDTELAWALGEAADICEMFLQNATGAEERNDKIVKRIDGLLAALNASEM